MGIMVNHITIYIDYRRTQKVNMNILTPLKDLLNRLKGKKKKRPHHTQKNWPASSRTPYRTTRSTTKATVRKPKIRAEASSPK